MSYRFIYSQSESNRIVPSVLIDKRAAIHEIKNQIGSVIKSFTDGQAAMITDKAIFYRIETNNGNIAGYATLAVIRDGVVSILQFELRPAFEQFSAEISANLSSFILNSDWVNDYL